MRVRVCDCCIRATDRAAQMRLKRFHVLVAVCVVVPCSAPSTVRSPTNCVVLLPAVTEAQCFRSICGHGCPPFLCPARNALALASSVKYCAAVSAKSRSMLSNVLLMTVFPTYRPSPLAIAFARTLWITSNTSFGCLPALKPGTSGGKRSSEAVSALLGSVNSYNLFKWFGIVVGLVTLPWAGEPCVLTILARGPTPRHRCLRIGLHVHLVDFDPHRPNLRQNPGVPGLKQLLASVQESYLKTSRRAPHLPKVANKSPNKCPTVVEQLRRSRDSAIP